MVVAKTGPNSHPLRDLRLTSLLRACTAVFTVGLVRGLPAAQPVPLPTGTSTPALIAASTLVLLTLGAAVYLLRVTRIAAISDLPVSGMTLDLLFLFVLCGWGLWHLLDPVLVGSLGALATGGLGTGISGTVWVRVVLIERRTEKQFALRDVTSARAPH